MFMEKTRDRPHHIKNGHKDQGKEPKGYTSSLV